MAKTKYEVVKAWRKKNPEKVAEQDRRYAAKHPETRRRASLKYRHANIDVVRVNDAERVRSKRKADPVGARLRTERFKAKKEAERERIAGRPRPKICDLCNGNHHLGIVFDHCHKTGKFRGWLCDRCNKVLGIVKDDPGLLRRMAVYLDEHNVEADQIGARCSTGH